MMDMDAVTFKDSLLSDLQEVFLNLNEFAGEHVFRGRPLVCIVDERSSGASVGSVSGLRNASGLGILDCDRIVLCEAGDVSPIPLPGERVEMDGWFWHVGDGVNIIEGLLTLPLNRAY